MLAVIESKLYQNCSKTALAYDCIKMIVRYPVQIFIYAYRRQLRQRVCGWVMVEGGYWRDYIFSEGTISAAVSCMCLPRP